MAKPQRKAYVNPAVGSKGLNLFDPARATGDFQCRTFTNLLPTKGGCRSRYGFTLFNQDTAKSGGITMLHWYKKANATKQLVFANDDDYWHLPASATTSTAWTTIGDYGTAVATPHAYTSKDFTIFGTGLAGNTPKKWDGTTFSSITTPAVAGNDLGFYEFFQGQDFAALFGAGDPSNPSRLYYSQANNPDVWTGGAAGYIDIALDDGFKITGLRAQGDQLIVYKERARYFVSTFYESSTGTYGVRVQPYKDSSGGAIAHDTIEILPNGDIVSLVSKMIGMQGFGKEQSADGSYLPKDYSRDVMPLFENVAWAYAYKAKSILWDKKLFLALPYGKQATANTYVFMLDVDSGGWSVFPDMPIGCFEIGEDSSGEECLYAGDAETAKIYKFDKYTYSDSGTMIQSRARTGKLNLGSIIDYEDLETVTLEGFMQEGDTLRLKVIVDGVEEVYTIDDSFLVNIPGSSSYLASDYVAEEYLMGEGDEFDVSQDYRWLAVLLVNASQRRAREIEVQLENDNSGANWGWSYLSINEHNFQSAKLLPEKHIIASSSSI